MESQSAHIPLLKAGPSMPEDGCESCSLMHGFQCLCIRWLQFFSMCWVQRLLGGSVWCHQETKWYARLVKCTYQSSVSGFSRYSCLVLSQFYIPHFLLLQQVILEWLLMVWFLLGFYLVMRPHVEKPFGSHV